MSGGVSHLDLCEKGSGCAWDAWGKYSLLLGMGGLEDDGVMDEEERHHIDEAWRKARRTKLVREAG
jgi:hypothetical protein